MIGNAVATLTRIAAGVSVRGAIPGEDGRQRIYFANHSSHLDFLVLWSSLPASLRRTTRPVAAADYWRTGPLRRCAAGWFSPVLIERHRPNGSSNPLGVMLTALEGRDSLILFPEGTRARDGAVAPFRGGLYHLARRRPDVEFVPVYLANLDHLLPKGEWLPVPLACSVSFGPSIRLLEGEPRALFLERARAAVLSLME